MNMENTSIEFVGSMHFHLDNVTAQIEKCEIKRRESVDTFSKLRQVLEINVKKVNEFASLNPADVLKPYKESEDFNLSHNFI